MAIDGASSNGQFGTATPAAGSPNVGRSAGTQRAGADRVDSSPSGSSWPVGDVAAATLATAAAIGGTVFVVRRKRRRAESAPPTGGAASATPGEAATGGAEPEPKRADAKSRGSAADSALSATAAWSDADADADASATDVADAARRPQTPDPESADQPAQKRARSESSRRSAFESGSTAVGGSGDAPRPAAERTSSVESSSSSVARRPTSDPQGVADPIPLAPLPGEPPCSPELLAEHARSKAGDCFAADALAFAIRGPGGLADFGPTAGGPDGTAWVRYPEVVLHGKPRPEPWADEAPQHIERQGPTALCGLATTNMLLNGADRLTEADYRTSLHELRGGKEYPHADYVEASELARLHNARVDRLELFGRFPHVQARSAAFVGGEIVAVPGAADPATDFHDGMKRFAVHVVSAPAQAGTAAGPGEYREGLGHWLTIAHVEGGWRLYDSAGERQKSLAMGPPTAERARAALLRCLTDRGVESQIDYLVPLPRGVRA